MPQYTIGEFARYAGVTQRTLRYYDKIGLLKPSAYTEREYRLYSDEDLIKLQNIIALRYLRFSLAEIQKIVQNEGETFTAQDSLKKQKEAFLKEKVHLSRILGTIERLEDNAELKWSDMTGLIRLIQSDEEVQSRFGEVWRRDAGARLFGQYGANPEGWTPFLFRMINIQPNENIFELDIGNGGFLMENATKMPPCQITISSMHQRVIDEVKKRWGRMNWANPVDVSFCRIPAGEFALPLKAYDKVLALHIFTRSAEIETTLRTCQLALRDGGSFYTTAIGHNHMKELFALARELDPQIHFYNMDSLDHFSVETGEVLLRQFFDEVEWHPYETHVETDDVEAMTDFLWATYSNIQEVLEGRKERLQRHVEKAVKKKGKLYITENTGIFSAK